jgi:Flp pilus assembly protein TadB
LWVKALSDSEGDLDKGQALYVKLRVQMIKDEWAHLDKVLAEKAKAKAEAKAEAKRKKQTSLLVQRQLEQQRSEAEQKRSEAKQRIAAEKSREAKRPIHDKKAKFAFRATLFFVVLFGVCVYRLSFLNDDSNATFAIFVISMFGAPLMFLKYLYHRTLGPRL